MNNGLWDIVTLFVFYLSVILHEVGHCIFPRLAGFDLFDVVVIGQGKKLFSIKLLGFYFRINKILIPYGGFYTTRRFEDVESYRQFMRRQTKSQIFFTHAGGSIMNLSIVIICWLFMIFLHSNTQSHNILNTLLKIVMNVNATLFLFNFIPLPIYNKIEEFSGSDIVQLHRRLKAHNQGLNSSM